MQNYKKGDFTMTKMKKLYLPVLTAAAITFSIFGMPKKAEASCNTYQVNVAKGYLALRTDTAFDSRNEIGELYNGDLVEVMDYTGATGYWYVYSPKYDTFGYVNNDYLNSISSSVSAYDTMWTVSVRKAIWHSVMQHAMTLPMKLASCIPAIMCGFATAAILRTGMYTHRS